MSTPIELMLIEHGEILSGGTGLQGSILCCRGGILQIGEVNRSALDSLGVPYDLVDATDHYVLPGLIDPHEHLAGGSGEKGYESATPPIFFEELVRGGITTVVGTLGVDTTMTVMPGLLGRVKAFQKLGISARMYSGGYQIPPATITGSIRNDLLLVSEVIGAGEICIADDRSTDPNPQELARVVSEAYVAGRLSGKAGISHFHVGPNSNRLKILRKLIRRYDIDVKSLYPTHVERSEKLMDEALEMVHQGAMIDVDVVEKDLPKWLRYYLDHEGDLTRLTVSSDSFMTGPHNLLEQISACVAELQQPLERLIPLVTSNCARILRLPTKGRVEPGMDADLALVDRRSLEVTDVIAGGRPLMRAGRLLKQEPFFEKTDRNLPRPNEQSRLGASGKLPKDTAGGH